MPTMEGDRDSAEAPATGPYVQIAAFCERVLTEADGVASLIRVVDRITTNLQALPPGTAPPPQLLTAVITLKSGQARGSHELTIQPESPSGLKLQPITVSVLLEGEDRGATLHLPIALPTDVSGLYWFDVRLDDRLMTRIPLRVVHQKLVLETSQAAQ